MCDQDHYDDDLKEYANPAWLSRRQFGTLASAAYLSMLLPSPADAQTVRESEVNIKTPDGTCDCYFVHPASGPSPGVIIWPDILGLRTAFRGMGKRLAESGYAVLVVNPFYRKMKAPVVPEGASFADPIVKTTVFPMAGTLNATTHTTDATALIAWMDTQSAVDRKRKMGTMGYCMGGPMTMRTVAASDRMGAGASFHGGNLVTKNPDSPHLLVPRMKASYLFAVAENDDKTDPEAKNVLRKAFADAKLPAEIEVYPAAHGWCPPDSPVYNKEQAERAWTRLLALFKGALA